MSRVRSLRPVVSESIPSPACGWRGRAAPPADAALRSHLDGGCSAGPARKLTGWILGACVLLVTVAGPIATSSAEFVGVLVIAHGGSDEWNEAVRHTVAQAKLAYPVEIAFGMGMHPEEVQRMQAAATRLIERGVTRLVVIPFLVSSHSEVMRQFEYLFGLREEAVWPEAGPPLRVPVALYMGRPLDDSPELAEVLLERAQALSRAPAQEALVLVAHGPVADDENQRWLETMETVAQVMRYRIGFRQIVAATIRDDAEEPVRQAAIGHLRETVERFSQEGTVLVVPVLIAQGGIERKIPNALEGLTYRYSGETLLPHPQLAQWVARRVSTLAASMAKGRGMEQAAVVE